MVDRDILSSYIKAIENGDRRWLNKLLENPIAKV